MVCEKNKERLEAAEKQLRLIKEDFEKNGVSKQDALFYMNIILAINYLNDAKEVEE